MNVLNNEILRAGWIETPRNKGTVLNPRIWARYSPDNSYKTANIWAVGPATRVAGSNLLLCVLLINKFKTETLFKQIKENDSL